MVLRSREKVIAKILSATASKPVSRSAANKLPARIITDFQMNIHQLGLILTACRQSGSQESFQVNTCACQRPVASPIVAVFPAAQITMVLLVFLPKVVSNITANQVLSWRLIGQLGLVSILEAGAHLKRAVFPGPAQIQTRLVIVQLMEAPDMSAPETDPR